MSYQDTHLWNRTLGEVPNDRWVRERATLRQAFESLRANMKWFLENIGCDLPHFTVHDVTHSDALWEMADLILGESYQITPIEAFILGATFLVHDAGMSAAARDETAFESSVRWRDSLALAIRRLTGRTPNEAEIAAVDQNTKREVFENLLRETHSEAVTQLLTKEWNSCGRSVQLLDNNELRLTYTALIGEIAASHWWPASTLRERFRTELGSLPGYPQQWTVNPLKLACALRVADAAHLDARRAPRMLMALRHPIGVSEAHWVFSQKLQQPRVYSDRLTYTSVDPFTVAQAQAWWFCFQALSVVDQELRLADSILVDLDLPRFLVKGVLGTDEPKALTRYIPTQGWTPVDTRIRVSGVADLVSKLGGENLYSQGPSAALRELIQNAADAIQARRIAEDRPPDWGEAAVSLVESDGWWLRVTDNGVGMSDPLLTGPFLDFGSSYWTSDLMITEHPGLLTKGFQPVGRFGIGFFSVFMLGDLVRVATRPYREARRATRVLEFSAGVSSVPLLRNAEESEQLKDGGTRVEVRLTAPPFSEKGLLGSQKRAGKGTLNDLVAWLCPATNISVTVEQASLAERVIAAEDWKTLPPDKLLVRCNPDAAADQAQRLKGRVLDIKDDSGHIIGRAAAHSWREPGRNDIDGVLVVGGLRASPLHGIAGVLFGEAATADREKAVPLADGTQLAAWANAQADAASKPGFQQDAAADIAAVVYHCGGEIGDLPFCYSHLGWMNMEELLPWVGRKLEILLVDIDFIDDAFRFVEDFTLDPNVLVVAGTTLLTWVGGGALWPAAPRHHRPHRWWNAHQRTLKGLVVSTLASYWAVSIDQILEASEFSKHPSDPSAEDRYIWRDIGRSPGGVLNESVEIIRRPKVSPQRKARAARAPRRK